MFDTLAQLRPQVRYSFWAAPGQGQSIEELIMQLRHAGNQILDVEDDRVLVARRTEDQDRWGCLLCLGQGAVTICDSNEELEAHCDEAHEGWHEA